MRNRDLVFGLVRDPYRRMLFPAPGSVSASRRAEAHDLSSGMQGFLADVLAAALSLPGCQRLATGAVRAGCVLARRNASPERSAGEHRPADRRSRGRGSGAGDDRRRDRRSRRARTNCGRRGSTASAASANRSRPRKRRRLSDAIRHLHHRFQGLYLIRPSHNPIRPLDLTGAYDERSDRVQTLEELMERGYEDAYRQFIEPFLGASGERMPHVARRSTTRSSTDFTDFTDSATASRSPWPAYRPARSRNIESENMSGQPIPVDSCSCSALLRAGAKRRANGVRLIASVLIRVICVIRG